MFSGATLSCVVSTILANVLGPSAAHTDNWQGIVSSLAIHQTNPVSLVVAVNLLPKLVHDLFRETLNFSDGGHMCLDWCNEKDNVADNESFRPTVIILPGLAGQ